MTILTEKTQIDYLPHCQICDLDPYHCDNCGYRFGVNQNSEKYDGDVLCIRYTSVRKKYYKNASMVNHACSQECATALIQKKKDNGLIRTTKTVESNYLVHYEGGD